MTSYGGGAECDTCGATGLGVADRHCRWCGAALRELVPFETPTAALREGGR